MFYAVWLLLKASMLGVSATRYMVVSNVRCLPFVKSLALCHAPDNAMQQYYFVVQLAHDLVCLV